MVHPQRQTPQGESVAKPETLLLIVLSTVCKYDIKEVIGNQSNPFFKKRVYGWKHPREVDNCRNSSPYIKHFILSKYWQHMVKDNQCPERAGHHRPSLSPSVNTNKTSGTPHQSDFKKYIIYQYAVHVSIQTYPEVIRRKHTAYLTGFSACSSTCNYGVGGAVRFLVVGTIG